jgi:hypothetical protein
MKNTIIALIIPLGLALGETKQPVAKTKATPPPTAVPADAKQIDVATWRHVDKDGKTWIYRRTPFGLLRFEEKDTQSEPGPDEFTTVREEGETLHFEKPSPFGKLRWSKKKSDLTGEEQAVWRRTQEKTKPADPKNAQER